MSGFHHAVLSADDQTPSGWFIRTPSAKPSPCIVVASADRMEVLPWHLRLANAGYHVMGIELRAHRFKGDLLSALEFVSRRAEVDPFRIGLVGVSTAAAAALDVASQHSEVAAVVADSTCATVDLRAVLAIGRISPRPVLIIHGELDRIVPVRHARLLYLAAHTPKELWIVAGGRHEPARAIGARSYAARLRQFFDQALDGPRDGSPAAAERLPREASWLGASAFTGQPPLAEAVTVAAA
ncbi:MAG: hypothetical protein JOZ81_25205 [Chloroflexi bacterium]|nr:hypothetical protein [Chloroflexota bacterium]